MKNKIITTLLCSLLIVNMGACSYESKNQPEISGEDCKQQSNEWANNDESKTSAENSESHSDNYIESSTAQSGREDIYSEKRRKYFCSNINENIYDNWLENEIAEGIRAERLIYTDYLNYWRNELAFTIQSGKTIFENESEYQKWKNQLDQWEELTISTLSTELNNLVLPATMTQANLIRQTSMLIRQKAIDTKWFLYQMKGDMAVVADEPYTEIPIEWALDSLAKPSY